MQLRKMTVMLTALGALSLMMTGCDPEPTDQGPCTQDTECAGNEICHPTARTCVSTCTSSNDCTANAKTCEPITPGSTTSVCKCESTQLCNQDRETADLLCSTLDEVCVKPCGSDADCSTGRTCDVATGQCKQGTTTPTCNPACAANETCDTTGATPVCRPTATSCQGTSQSTCAYGQYCSSNTCTAAPVAPTDNTCPNFSTNRPPWDPSLATGGPVIYEVTKRKFTATGNQTCTAGQSEIHLSVRAYRTDQDWPTTKSGLGINGFFYVATNTSRQDVIGDQLLIPDSFGGGYFRNANNPKDAEFRFYICPPANSNNLPVGIYFTGGNPVCTTLTR
jgi:hypothetical protein